MIADAFRRRADISTAKGQSRHGFFAVDRRKGDRPGARTGPCIESAQDLVRRVC